MCGMVSLVYWTKADTKISGWKLLGRELWDLIDQLRAREELRGPKIRRNGPIAWALSNGSCSAA